MNEVLYESHCEYTQGLLREVSRHTRSKGYTLYCGALFLVLIFIECRYIFVYRRYGFAVFLGCMLLFCLAEWLAMPLINAKKQYRSALGLYQGKCMTTTVRIYEDKIEHINTISGGRVCVAYDEIKRVVETGNLFILIMRGQVCIVLPKAEFTVGEPESFVNFISMKTGR